MGVFDVASEDEPYELISVHADAIGAFPTYVRAAASALAEWGAAELTVEATRRGPRFKVSRPIECVGDRFALTLLQLRQPAVVLAALRVEAIDDEGLRAEVGRAMAQGPAALQRLFGIGEAPLHKQLAIDRWSALALFLEESPWRFSLCETGDPMGSLAIEYLNKMGNRIGPLVYIARHRGCIAWVDRERAYVAFEEYHAHKPCALLRGLSKTAAAELQTCFEDPAPDKIYLTDDDRQRLDRMRALPIPMWPH